MRTPKPSAAAINARDPGSGTDPADSLRLRVKVPSTLSPSRLTSTEFAVNDTSEEVSPEIVLPVRLTLSSDPESANVRPVKSNPLKEGCLYTSPLPLAA